MRKRNSNRILRNTLITLGVIAVLALIYWVVVGLVFDSDFTVWSFFINNIWLSWLFPSGWNLFGATPFFWFLVLTVILSTAGYVYYKKNKDPHRRSYYRSSDAERVAAIVTSALLIIGVPVFAFTTFQWGLWNAEYYNRDSVYVVPDTEDLPNTLSRVASHKSPQVEIAEGQMPDSWVPRVASATGATYVMEKTGDMIQNTELLSETISYIYGDTEAEGHWTAIRNGTNRQPIYGVASWSGAGEKVETCKFSGDNTLNKTFGGILGMNLNNEIAKFKPTFVYSMHDVYGYCDGDTPVIVIPGREVVGNGIQAANNTAGVMTIMGSSSGDPVFEYFDEVSSGQFPGPVYSKTLASEARDGLTWSIGRVWPWQPKVGFVASDSVTQEGNSTDFLLKDTKDGRLYWVTPLRPTAATMGETISAYSLTPADEVTKGELNETKVYVFNDDNPNIVNFNDLFVKVQQAVSKADPGFFTGDEDAGKIVEFIPTSESEWRVFAEKGGRAVYQINVSGGSLLRTQIVDLEGDNDLFDESSGDPVGLDGVIDEGRSQGRTEGLCGTSVEDLSDKELIDCLAEFSTELSKRN